MAVNRSIQRDDSFVNQIPKKIRFASHSASQLAIRASHSLAPSLSVARLRQLKLFHLTTIFLGPTDQPSRWRRQQGANKSSEQQRSNCGSLHRWVCMHYSKPSCRQAGKDVFLDLYIFSIGKHRLSSELLTCLLLMLRTYSEREV